MLNSIFILLPAFAGMALAQGEQGSALISPPKYGNSAPNYGGASLGYGDAPPPTYDTMTAWPSSDMPDPPVYITPTSSAVIMTPIPTHEETTAASLEPSTTSTPVPIVATTSNLITSQSESSLATSNVTASSPTPVPISTVTDFVTVGNQTLTLTNNAASSTSAANGTIVSSLYAENKTLSVTPIGGNAVNATTANATAAVISASSPSSGVLTAVAGLGANTTFASPTLQATLQASATSSASQAHAYTASAGGAANNARLWMGSVGMVGFGMIAVAF